MLQGAFTLIPKYMYNIISAHYSADFNDGHRLWVFKVRKNKYEPAREADDPQCKQRGKWESAILFFIMMLKMIWKVYMYGLVLLWLIIVSYAFVFKYNNQTLDLHLTD